jgi:hypothetical protein
VEISIALLNKSRIDPCHHILAAATEVKNDSKTNPPPHPTRERDNELIEPFLKQDGAFLSGKDKDNVVGIFNGFFEARNQK